MRKHNIYHRDLKPSNILYDMKTKTFKIADFGVSKILKEKEDYDRYVHETFIGTPLYMAPELLRKESYNSDTDIWSLGIIFYKLLEGVVPYTART